MRVQQEQISLQLLTSPMRGAEVIVLIVCVCVCVYVCVCLSVCYRCSGRYAYSTSPTKVLKESAHHKDQNKRRNKAKTS